MTSAEWLLNLYLLGVNVGFLAINILTYVVVRRACRVASETVRLQQKNVELLKAQAEAILAKAEQIQTREKASRRYGLVTHSLN